MSDFLIWALRISGAGLVLLAVLHVPIGRRLRWREDAAKMEPTNEAIFHVHNFFICVTIALMGLPSLVEPEIFVEKSRAGLWFSTMIAAFWVMRLYCQFFVYPKALWHGKRMESFFHWFFAVVWVFLSVTYGLAAAGQWGG